MSFLCLNYFILIRRFRAADTKMFDIVLSSVGALFHLRLLSSALPPAWKMFITFQNTGHVDLARSGNLSACKYTASRIRLLTSYNSTIFSIHTNYTHLLPFWITHFWKYGIHILRNSILIGKISQTNNSWYWMQSGVQREWMFVYVRLKTNYLKRCKKRYHSYKKVKLVLICPLYFHQWKNY